MDKEIWTLVEMEKNRINEGLELIPSENFPSNEVLKAMGTVLNNKYAEGYPNKRYYGGNEVIDIVEKIAIERAKKLFGAEHVNVQPYSGSPANMAVYFALLNPGEIVMGLSLAHGGHLTHGFKISFSGKYYKAENYLLGDDGFLDYDLIQKRAEEVKPQIIVSGYSAYPREIDFKKMQEIAESVGAYHLADISHIAGLIVAGVHKSPFPYTDVVTTTTHKTLRGPRGAIIMCKEEFGEKIDKAVFPGLQGGPHEHVIAAKAIAFKEAMSSEFKEYGKQIVKNAKVLAEKLMDYGFELVTGGTDNHLMLINLENTGMWGAKAEKLLDEAGITVNKNMIPHDKRKPMDPSGIRLGTPAVTTRGMKEDEMEQIAEWTYRVIIKKDEPRKVRNEVRELCAKYPVYL